ncbi:MAG: nucleotidyl transferase AbiEii/AbiGii toxin family protein [Candidatus Marsarchaeota archaeon]|jgi:predicted nucleotidyltransferase component of viral defense system|nr:nucleotidyl transferase AbiEii/AbiGii toxin family protein [Candidatus Marsarchaeota archaeon]
MLNINELKNYLNESRMQNIWQVERDYLQHIMLSAIYSNKDAVKGNNLIFKGGTALQKQGIIDRFSIDLDFVSELDFETLKSIFEYVRIYLTNMGIISNYQIEKNDKSIVAKFIINGPQYEYIKIDNAKAVIRLEISLREQIVFTPQRNIRIIPIYKDIKPYIIICIDINEIISEKIRAIMTRNKPRDVYDLWILIKKNYNVYEFLVREKLNLYKITFTLKEFIKQIELEKTEWNTELQNLLFGINKEIIVPDFDEVENDLINYFKNNNTITLEFDQDNVEPIIDDKKYKIKSSKITALVEENIKIKDSAIYPKSNSKIIVFAYKEYKSIDLLITQGQNNNVNIKLQNIKYPITTQQAGYNLRINKNEKLEVQLLMENNRKINEKIILNVILKTIEV